WVLAAAPITAVFRDVFRYVYGRLSDPPLPAGVLPGRPPQILPDSRLFGPFIPNEPPPPTETPVPIAYRRSRALRRSR
ncbi:MAG TPA: AI-2E family transporter, partial [Chloroflexota bacterium]|nr:AI-2E family transporter [Chloroflexota bacterium]